MPRILVVDDDQELRLLAGKYIQERGHEVFFAKDAFEAHDFLNKFGVDLVILDVNMPHKNGFTFLAELRGMSRFTNLPVILMTARNEKKDLQKALSLGAVYYIVKPFQRESFIDHIDKYLPKSAWDKTEFYSFPHHHQPVIAQAMIQNEFQILSLSELIFNVVSPVSYPEGVVIEIKSNFLKSLDLTSLHFRVLSSEPYSKGRSILQLLLLGEQKDAQVKIRNWLKKQAKKAS